MSKKIIAVALLVLAVTVLFAACKKEEYKVSDTVQVGTTLVDIYEDKDGNEYVTNVDGDMIPVTTDAEGFYDDIEDLLTETTTKKNKNNKTTTTTTTTTTTKPSSSTTTTTTTTNKNNENDVPSTSEKAEESTSKQVGAEIGDSNNKDSSISWNDIVPVP